MKIDGRSDDTIDMRPADLILDEIYLDMRGRLVALAADLDRIERGDGGPSVLASDPRIAALRDVLSALDVGGPNRAERAQMILSDRTPPPR